MTTLEPLVEDWFPPWCKNLDCGLESVECEFETDLIVALASAAVGDSEAAFLLGDGNLGTSDDWTSEGGTEEVNVLVDSVTSNGRVAKLFDELEVVSLSVPRNRIESKGTYFSTQVLNVTLACTNLESLRFGGLKVLLLANIGHEANYFITLLLLQR